MNTIDNFSIYASPNTLDGLNVVSETISTDALLVDGTNSMNADLNVASHKITNLSNGVNPSDAATVGQLPSTSGYLPLTGGTMMGSISMGGNKITNLGSGVANTDAVSVYDMKSYTLNQFLGLSGGTINGPLTVTNGTLLGGNADFYGTLRLWGDMNLHGGWINGSNTGTPPTSDTLISLGYSQNQINAAIGNYLPKSGGAMTGTIAMGNNKITGIADGTLATDAAAFGQIASATSAYLPLNGGTMSGILFMGWNKIQNVAPGGSGLDAPNIDQMNSAITSATSSYLPKSGGAMTGPIAMGASKITGIGNGTLATDAAAFGQIASATANYLPLTGGTISGALSVTGLITAGANMNMGSHKITQLLNGTANQDAAAFGQIAAATANYLPLAGGAMTGAIDSTASYVLFGQPPVLYYTTPFSYGTSANSQGSFKQASFSSVSVGLTTTTLATLSNLPLGMYLIIAQIGTNNHTVTSAIQSPDVSFVNMTGNVPTYQIPNTPAAVNGATFIGYLMPSSITNSITFKTNVTIGTINAGGYLISIRIA